MLQLYDYWRSSAAYRVRIGLNLKGLAYESIPVNIMPGSRRMPVPLARKQSGSAKSLDGQSR